MSSSTLSSAASSEPTRFRPRFEHSSKSDEIKRPEALTNDRPIPRAWDPQHLDLDRPPTVHTQRRQPHPVQRIRAPGALPCAAEVQRLSIDIVARNITRTIEARVEAPRTARYREIPGRACTRRKQGHPRREFICVVPDEEALCGEEGVQIHCCGIERAHEKARLRRGRVVRPGRARAQVEAVSRVTLRYEYMR